MMNEINKLIWPAEEGIGYVAAGSVGPHRRDRAEHAERSTALTFITAEPDEGACTNDIVDAAYELLGDSVDLNGADYDADPEVEDSRPRRPEPDH